MGLNQITEAAAQALCTMSTRYGRRPEPIPEMDPWEQVDVDDPRRGQVTVVFPGMPAIAVHLCADLEDRVTLDDTIDFDTPRADTLELVEAVLAGRARRRPASGRLLPSFFRELLQGYFGIVLAIPVHGGKVYTQRVPANFIGLTWVTTLPESG